MLTKAEKQEQEAAVGGGPPGPQAGWSSLQGHGLWRTDALISPPLPHHCVPPATLPQASAEGSLGSEGSDLHRPPGRLCGRPLQHQPAPAPPIWEAGPHLRGQGESARPPTVRAHCWLAQASPSAGQGRVGQESPREEAGLPLALAYLCSPLNTGELSDPHPTPQHGHLPWALCKPRPCWGTRLAGPTGFPLELPLKAEAWAAPKGVPHGLGVRTLGFHCCGPASVPGRGTEVTRATHCSQNTTEGDSSSRQSAPRVGAGRHSGETLLCSLEWGWGLWTSVGRRWVGSGSLENIVPE